MILSKNLPGFQVEIFVDHLKGSQRRREMRNDTVDWLVVMLTHASKEAGVALETDSHQLHVLVLKVFIMNQPKYQ